jgi:hypothetical protein
VTRVGLACIAETRSGATLQLPTETPAWKTSVANLQRGEARQRYIDDESPLWQVKISIPARQVIVLVVRIYIKGLDLLTKSIGRLVALTLDWILFS